jgi:hypothetical protein
LIVRKADLKKAININYLSGAANRIRTCDPVITNVGDSVLARRRGSSYILVLTIFIRLLCSSVFAPFHFRGI